MAAVAAAIDAVGAGQSSVLVIAAGAIVAVGIVAALTSLDAVVVIVAMVAPIAAAKAGAGIVVGTATDKAVAAISRLLVTYSLNIGRRGTRSIPFHSPTIG